jgi:23S rRNA (cytosine1962-C5)-methyltransferase
MSDTTPLANRLKKNARHLIKWARREGLEAYRLYDRDIPEFPYAIDRYGDWLHVQLFEGKRPFTDDDIAAHLAAIAATLELPAERVVLKLRRRQRGTSQYEKLDLQGPSFTVSERGLKFEVNLHRYLDTGLFLDHRDTRRLVGQEAAGKDMLNLFAYTGSFTVYAAAGGARRTVTVDMSKTYQAWTWRNLALNGFDDPRKHELVASDVLSFLQRSARAGSRFDLIVLDPPSFSNSKRMAQSFDVQRDHGGLLRATAALLAPGGALYFSNNRQGFKLDAQLPEDWRIEEITRQTVPEDFKRQPPHRCWRIQVG